MEQHRSEKVAANVQVVDGDLFEIDADAIVNAWNRNIIPWWLLIPGGVSGQIKKRGGVAPFRELARHGPMNVGDAVVTGGGRLGRPIIHVAGLNMRWRATSEGVAACTRNAVAVALHEGFGTIAMPVIGAGHGGLDEEIALQAMLGVLAELKESGAQPDGPEVLDVVVVRWSRTRQ